MRYFQLVRKEDVSGVSGTGVVAEGVEFHDGQVVVSWFGKYHSMGVFPNVKEVLNVHGHDGRTIVRWLGAVNTRPKEAKSWN